MSVEVQLDGVFENEVELSKKNEVIEEKLDFVEEALFEMERGSGDQYEFDKIETDLGQISAKEEEIKAEIDNLKMQVQSENEVYNSLEFNLFTLNGTMKDVLAEVAERRSDFQKLKVGIYDDQDKTRTKLESFNTTLSYLQENIEDLQEDFADTKTATIVLEARATKLEREMDERIYEVFTDKFTEVDEKLEQIRNSRNDLLKV
jgi:chromosome segregation ATPase